MLAVSISPRSQGSSNVSLDDVPRPQIEHPSDAIVMVTTAAIGQWEINRARRDEVGPTPGAQFAGVVIETGEEVSQVNVDDLVVATCAVAGSRVEGAQVFGRCHLAGGHAEYVLVPYADRVLTRTTPAAEERSVFAGGSAALGIAAAETALEHAAGTGAILAYGCDATGLTALAWLRRNRKRLTGTSYAFDPHPARLAAAKAYGAEEISVPDVVDQEIAVLILAPAAAEEAVEQVLTALRPGTTVVVTDPLHSAPLPDRLRILRTGWPALQQARRAEMAIRLREIDLTPLVSTVVPLDEAEEAYRVAAEAPPGTRSVLLKP